MNKGKFIQGVMIKHSMTHKDAACAVDAVFEQIRDTLLTGDEVRISDVGKLILKYREARTIINNLTGLEREVDPTLKIKFKTFRKMSKLLKENISDISEGLINLKESDDEDEDQ